MLLSPLWEIEELSTPSLIDSTTMDLQNVVDAACVKSLMGAECTMCARSVLWVQGGQWGSL